MKKLLLFALALIVSVSSFSQKYVVTPTGIKDETNPEKSFLVINVEGKTAKQLFDNALKYVNLTYKNPNMVIKGKIDNEYLSFVTHSDFYVENGLAKAPFGMDYLTELTFKDGKVKYEITELVMKNTAGYELTFIGSGVSFFIYNKSGDLKKPKTKDYLETYFNSELPRIKEFLEDKTVLTNKDDF
jgi:hypothetical protein